MNAPARLVDVHLDGVAEEIGGLERYREVRGLVRIHGEPLGWVSRPVAGGQCAVTDLRRAALERHGDALVRHLLADRLALGAAAPADLLDTPHPAWPGPWPTVTVAVCTRDRAGELARCLAALERIDYPALELLVVDNAPRDDAAQRLVAERHRGVRYVREARPGLDHARNRAAREARGEIIAYTDDDAVPDPGWARALAIAFGDNADAAAVMGLVVPYELETDAQALFERYGGFGRGFERRWLHGGHGRTRAARRWGSAAEFGTGCNMAFRRRVLLDLGGFHPALDVGTPSSGGGDLEMLYRTLHVGHTVLYEPAAIVRHRHRPEYARLRAQLAANGTSYVAYLLANAERHPNERGTFVRHGLAWLWRWNVRRLLGSFLRAPAVPRDLMWAELRGALGGVSAWRASLRTSGVSASSKERV